MAPGPAAADAVAPAASASGRQLGWAAVLSFGSRRGEEASPAGTSRPSFRPRKRTVPVDGELVARPAGRDARRSADEEARKGSRVPGCCFLPPARAPGRKHSTTMESNMNHKPREQAHTKQQPARPQGDTNPPPEAPAAPRFQATAARPRAAPTETRPPTPTRRDTANEDDAPARESLTAKASAAGGGDGEKVGVGAFGPAVGLSVVAAVSMAGLLGGRLWAVACVCAWVAALSRLQRPEAPVAAGGGTARSDGGEGLVVGVDSRDHKKLVVLRGLFERDRTKAVTA